jgi:glycosyltransferase involved in cell wall biosynthesis
MRPRADLILPCYNPPTGWLTSIEKLYEHLSPAFDIRVIIVDDGTTTQDIKSTADSLSHKVPCQVITLKKNCGKGFALRTGVKASQAGYIVYTDIDIPFTAGSVEQLLRVLTGGDYDIVAGYRDSAYYRHTMSGPRRRLSKTFRLFMRKVLRVSLDDTQCGLKGFNARGREIFLDTRVNRYLFDFEFIYQALRDKSVKVGSVAVELKDNIQFSSMRWPVIVRESLSLAGVLWRSRRRPR